MVLILMATVPTYPGPLHCCRSAGPPWRPGAASCSSSGTRIRDGLGAGDAGPGRHPGLQPEPEHPAARQAPRQSTKGMALWPSWELGFRGFWGTLGSLGGTRQETTWGQVRGIPGASGTILESLVGCLVASLVLSSPDSTEPGE